MKPHEERVAAELKELQEKIDKLAAFFQTETFANIPEAEDAVLLAHQMGCMQEYAAILRKRIARFEV